MTTPTDHSIARGMRALAPQLASAELHYWRVDPSAWGRLLDGARSLGLETVASYVQWQAHEVADGRYDLHGVTSPRLDLVSYIDLVADRGMNLIIRPGPYTFAEWRNYGVPDRVVEEHRLTPAFLEAAGAWIDAVCEVLVPRLATNGGPIILLQADNMFDLGANRYDRTLGLLGGDGVFQEYLRERYGTIEALASAWSAPLGSFEEARAMTLEVGDHAASHPRYLDFTRFRSWFAERAATWTVERYRAAGIDVPIYTNAIRDQDMARTAAVVDLVGLNHYPTHGYHLPDEHRRLLDHVRLGAAMSPIAYVAELEAGIWHGYHYTKGILPAEQYQLMFATLLAGGVQAWNWYMLHDRDNWYMAPFNENGDARVELVDVFQRCVATWRTGRVWEWQHASRTAIAFSSERSAAEACDLIDADVEVQRAMYDAGIDLRFVRPADAPDDVLLFVEGGAWLPRTDLEALRDWVERGGHLVCVGVLPGRDADLAIDDALGIVMPDGSSSQGYMNTFHKDVVVDVGLGGPVVSARLRLPTAVGTYASVPGTPIQATIVRPAHYICDDTLGEYQRIVELGTGERVTVGYHLARGKGHMTVLAVAPTAGLVRAIHQAAGVDLPAVPRSPNTIGVLFRRASDRYMAVINTSEVAQVACVDLAPHEVPEGRVDVRDLLSTPERADAWLDAERHRVHVALEGRSGTIVAITAMDEPGRD